MSENETNSVQKPTGWLYVRFPNRLINSVKEHLDRKSPFDSVTLDIRLYRNGKDSQGNKLPKAENPLLFESFIFIQGQYSDVKKFFLQENITSYKFMPDCARDGGAAEIPDDKMRELRQLAESESERLSFLPKPFEFYADSNDIIRITSGRLEGLEGCIVRIDHDRKLVMQVGDSCVAVSNIYLDLSKMDRKNFEVVVPKEQNTSEINMSLIEQAIAQLFHTPLTEKNIGIYDQNLELMTVKARSMYRRGKHLAAMETLLCLMKEMSKNIPDEASFSLAPIKRRAKAIRREVNAQLSDSETSLTATDIIRLRTETDEVFSKFPNLFGKNATLPIGH